MVKDSKVLYSDTSSSVNVSLFFWIVVFPYRKGNTSLKIYRCTQALPVWCIQYVLVIIKWENLLLLIRLTWRNNSHIWQVTFTRWGTYYGEEEFPLLFVNSCGTVHKEHLWIFHGFTSHLIRSEWNHYNEFLLAIKSEFTPQCANFWLNYRIAFQQFGNLWSASWFRNGT